MHISLPDHSQHSHKTDIHTPGGFEPTIPVSEQLQSHTLGWGHWDLPVTNITSLIYEPNNIMIHCFNCRYKKARIFCEIWSLYWDEYEACFWTWSPVLRQKFHKCFDSVRYLRIQCLLSRVINSSSPKGSGNYYQITRCRFQEDRMRHVLPFIGWK
jgi:hypothetical protein